MQTEKEKRAELYTFLWETFKHSQAEPVLHKFLFYWLKTFGDLPKIPSKPPWEIYNSFHSPSEHAENGQLITINWGEAKKWIESLTLETWKKTMLRKLLNEKILSSEDLGAAEAILENIDDTHLARIPLLIDTVRKKEIMRMWETLVLIKKNPSPNFIEKEYEALQETLYQMIERDLDFLSGKRTRARTGKSSSPDDEKDRRASFVRRFVIKQDKKIQIPGLRLLYQKLNKILLEPKGDEVDLLIAKEMRELKKYWEKHHPEESFYENQTPR